eukprot:4462045-Pleurochrysis_carterae.AAC.1
MAPHGRIASPDREEQKTELEMTLTKYYGPWPVCNLDYDDVPVVTQGPGNFGITSFLLLGGEALYHQIFVPKRFVLLVSKVISIWERGPSQQHAERAPRLSGMVDSGVLLMLSFCYSSVFDVVPIKLVESK